MSANYLSGFFKITRACGHSEDSHYSGDRAKEATDLFIKKESDKKCFKCDQSESYDLTLDRC